jgi:hypothetical protein
MQMGNQDILAAIAADPAAVRRAQQAYDDLSEPEPDETDGLIDSIRIAIARCEEALGRAELALTRRDTDAAQDLVRSAINELEEVAAVEAGV